MPRVTIPIRYLRAAAQFADAEANPAGYLRPEYTAVHLEVVAGSAIISAGRPNRAMVLEMPISQSERAESDCNHYAHIALPLPFVKSLPVSSMAEVPIAFEDPRVGDGRIRLTVPSTAMTLECQCHAVAPLNWSRFIPAEDNGIAEQVDLVDLSEVMEALKMMKVDLRRIRVVANGGGAPISLICGEPNLVVSFRPSRVLRPETQEIAARFRGLQVALQNREAMQARR